MSRRRRVIAALALAAPVIAGVAGWWLGRITPEPSSVASVLPPLSVPIEQGSVTTEIVTRGTVRHEGATPVRVLGGGTVTIVPEAGRVLYEGDMLVEVDGRPVVVLVGERPMYRGLQEGTVGPDVVQLKAALSRLGYPPGPLDSRFTAETHGAWAAFRADQGAVVDEGVGGSEIVFMPSLPLLVTDVAATRGDAAAGVVATLSSPEPLAVAWVTSDERLSVAEGDVLSLSGPEPALDPTGLVVHVATEPGTHGAAEDEYAVVADLDDPASARSLQGLPMRAAIVSGEADSEGLVVPVSTIHTRADGTAYVLRLQDTELMPVTVTIVYSNGISAIVEGDLDTDDRVGIPE